MPEFREYPKRVYPEGGKGVRVNSAAEEAEALKGAKAPAKVKDTAPTSGAPDPAKPDRKALIAAAKEKGVKKANFLSTEELQKALA